MDSSLFKYIMKKNIFSSRALLKSAIPSYLFPLLFSGIPGYLMDNPDLILASYTTISLSSLLATIVCFGLLGLFQSKQILLYNKYIVSLGLCLLMVIVSFSIINIFNLHNAYWNIIPSAIIGAVIIALTKPLQKNG